MAELKITRATLDKVLKMADALEVAIDGLMEISKYDIQAEDVLNSMKRKLGVTDEEPEGPGKETLRM